MSVHGALWWTVNGVFHPHDQCYQGGLQIHYNPDQDNKLSEDEIINIFHEKIQTQSDGTCSVQIQDWNRLQQIPQSANPIQILSKERRRLSSTVISGFVMGQIRPVLSPP